MDQFDRNVLPQFHQQAITHALAPQQSQKQVPCQLVFPDDTMAIGSLAVARVALFPTDREGTHESEEDRQRRLLQNEPIVVYTSLSEHRLLVPELTWRVILLLLIIAVQVVCILVILTGGAGDTSGDDTSVAIPSPCQMGLYAAQLALHLFFFISMYFWNVDMLKVYSVSVTLILFLILVLTTKSLLDLVACVLCAPIVILSSCLRNLMMPHCFTIRR